MSGESMSSAAGSPAKTSVLPGRGPASTGSGVGCGRSTFASFASFDLDSSSWRTSQRCLVGGWVEFSETWPRAGMTRNGTAYRLPQLVPRTSATGCSLLPTPTANDAKNSTLPPSQRGRDSIPGYLLRSQFPTPKASDGERGGRGELLALVRGKKTRQMWPTPQAADGSGGRRESVLGGTRPSGTKRSVSLATAVNFTAQNEAMEAIAGQLNPQWVEWLMGFPIGWTDLGDSETPSSPRSPSGSAGG